MFNIDVTQLSEFDYKNVKIIKKEALQTTPHTLLSTEVQMLKYGSILP